jgi:hypothetical protein
MVTGPQPVFYRLYTGASRKTLELLLCFYNFIIAYVSSVQTLSRHAGVENKANIVGIIYLTDQEKRAILAES